MTLAPFSRIKKCPRCGEEKPTTEYVQNPLRPDGVAPYCFPCGNDYARSVYHQKRFIDPIGVWARVASGSAKRRAVKAGVAFALTASLLVSLAPPDCPVLGFPLDYSGAGMGAHHTKGASATVDRIVPSEGYIPENIIVVSMRANLIKQNASPDEILRVGSFYANLLHHKT